MFPHSSLVSLVSAPNRESIDNIHFGDLRKSRPKMHTFMNPCLVKHFPAYFLRPRENTCKVFGGENNGILFIIVVVDCRQSLTL